MAEPTDEEKRAAERKELAEAIADGFEIVRSRDEERAAKALAEKGGDNGSTDTKPRLSLAERLLGHRK